MSEASEDLQAALRHQKVKVARLERRSVLGSSLKLERARERRIATELSELTAQEAQQEPRQTNEPVRSDSQTV